MNAEQIARLSRVDLATINAVFDGERPLIEGFGYVRIAA